MKKGYYPVLLLTALLLSYACRPDEACIGSGSNSIGLQFAVPNDTLATPPADTTVVIRRIYTPTVPDTDLFPITAADIIAAEGRGLRDLFRLRLDPNRDTSVFVFEADRRTDSLFVGYQRRYQLLSPDCPINVNYQQLRVIRHTFTDVDLERTDLTDFSATPDIYIYY